MLTARRKPVQREKGEQAQIVATARQFGGREWVFGTRRSRGKACPKCGTFVPEDQGTRQTRGAPDVLLFMPVPVFAPDGSVSSRRPVLVFIECKAEGGRLSPEQRDFRDLCRQAAVHHVTGGLNAFIAWLLEQRVCREHQFAHYRLPKGGH